MTSNQKFSLPESAQKKLSQILDAHIGGPSDTKDKLLGGVFVVLDKDDILYQGSAGYSTFSGDSPAYDLNTQGWIASLTKLITATSVLRLVEKGDVTLDEDVKPRLPGQLASLQILKGFDKDEKPILEDNNNPITLRHLLTHTTGLGYIPMEPGLMKWQAATGHTAQNNDWTLAGLTQPLLEAPGKSWRYGISYDWAGLVLEQVTGQRLGDYFRENIFAPLGMSSMTFWPDKPTAAFATRGPDGTLFDGPRTLAPVEHELESGGAGLFGTAADYTRFLQGLLQGKLLSQKYFDLLFEGQLDEALRATQTEAMAQMWAVYAPELPERFPTDQSLGGCLNVKDVPGKRKKGSLMWSGLPNCHWWIDRETGIAAVFVTTTIPPGDVPACKVFDELERALYAGLSK